MAPLTALGDAIAVAAPGAILALKGMCKQQVTIASAFDAGLAVTNESGSPTAPLMSGDGLEGEIRIAARIDVFINGVALVGPASDLGYASVLSATGGRIVVSNAQISDGWRTGLALAGNAVAEITNTAIERNGRAGVAGQTDGIRATGGASLVLGQLNADGSVDPLNAVGVNDNIGNGITALANSSVTLAGGIVSGNGASQLVLGSASANLIGTEIHETQSVPVARNFAVEAIAGSKLVLMDGALIQAGVSGGGVLATSASSITMTDATIENASTTATIQISGGSNAVLAGGNTISNGANAAAIQLDHVSSLIQSNDSMLNVAIRGAPNDAASADAITGNGIVAEQSTIELGIGLVGGNPGLTWQGSITVEQNSSLRLQGGVAVTGRLTLAQGSNGFFNVANGGTNVITAGVICSGTATGAPAAHVVIASPTAVVVAPGSMTSAVTIGPTRPACLSF